MAKYWVFLNDQVIGPFPVEQLIRMRNFSRQTPVCVDDMSGKPGEWITPPEIPELAAIFKAADQYHEIPPPRASKPTPKPVPPRPAVPRGRVRPTESATPPEKSSSGVWIAISCL